MCGKDGTGMTAKADGLIPRCVPKQDGKKYIRRHKMYTRVPREVCLRENWKSTHQDRMGGD